MTRELILKRYKRGMTAEQIAAIDDLSLEYVEEVISSSGVKPLNRKNINEKSAEKLISDDELIHRIRNGQTRSAIEKYFEVAPGVLTDRINRLKELIKKQDEIAEKNKQIDTTSVKELSKKQQEVAERDRRIVECYNRGMTLQEMCTELNLSPSYAAKLVKKLGITMARPVKPEKEDVKTRNKRIAEFVSQGMTAPEIADELKLDLSYLYKLLRELNLKAKKQKPRRTKPKKGISGEDFHAIAELMLKDGKTLKEIGEATGVSFATASHRINADDALKTLFEEQKLKRQEAMRVPVDLNLVRELLQKGETLLRIAEEIDVPYNIVRRRVNEHADMKGLADENAQAVRRKNGIDSQNEADLAAQETAVTTESDGFETNYTIAALVKEEPEMTEAIAEVKKDVQEVVPTPVETTEGMSTWELLEEAQRKENAKWIHFIASQMQNAVITSTLDVEDRNGQLVKVEKVTFTRVQTL